MEKISAAIEAVKYTSKRLNIPVPNIKFVKKDDSTNSTIKHYYDYKNNEIVFNEDWLYSTQTKWIVYKAIHETRHVYQYYVVKKNLSEVKDSIKTRWAFELEFYLKPKIGINSEIDESHYYNEIELDATFYAFNLLGYLIDGTIKKDEDTEKLIDLIELTDDNDIPSVSEYKNIREKNINLDYFIDFRMRRDVMDVIPLYEDGREVDTYDYESLRVIDVSYENNICYVVVEKMDK